MIKLVQHFFVHSSSYRLSLKRAFCAASTAGATAGAATIARTAASFDGEVLGILEQVLEVME